LAVKLLYYFLFIFIAIAVLLLYQKPYSVEVNKSNKNTPIIEMLDMVNYSITEEGVAHIIKASKVLRFANYDEFYDIDATRKSEKNGWDNLKSNSGKLVNDDLSLRGNIRYVSSDNVKFDSQEADYNLKTKVFKTDLDFRLEDKSSVTHGTSMVYKTKEDKVYVNKIRSKIEVQ